MQTMTSPYEAGRPNRAGYRDITPEAARAALGTVRMGRDERTAPLDEHGNFRGVENLFVADGGPFVSQADKNPTWTIMALAWRTADHITAQRKAGAL